MRTRTLPCKRRSSGMTLLELTVVILVLLTLIGILFIGARAWKSGSDRAQCMINASNVQKAVRGFQNARGLSEGTFINYVGTIVGPGCFFDSEPTCATYGDYEWKTQIPTPGVCFIDCWDPDNSAAYHYPQNSGDW